VKLPLITPVNQKLGLIQDCGVEVVLCVRFDENLAQLSADDFVDKLLVGRLGVAEMVVGYDFTFGHKGLGDLNLLRQKGERAGFAVNALGPVIVDGQPVSSTRVRQIVRGTDMEAAYSLLGRIYRVAGRVVRGHRRGGRVLGYPTANLHPDNELLPGPGVYAVLVELADALTSGVTNIGTNPTFGNGQLTVETFLLDYDGDLYGRKLALRFVQFLRPERRFPSADELAVQISCDVEQARAVLAP
jgi:riboflavin kinase/FMN adenylyltransferase